MKSTGERIDPSIYNQNTYEHLHRYALTFEFLQDKIVLDIACGEGYGSNLMSKIASRVIGVDYNEEIINHAKSKYTASNIEFKVGNVDSIPIENNSIDVVVSFETIEHHEKHDEMLTEVKRVLKKNGILIISTPDKKFYSDTPNYTNNFHVKELHETEFNELLKLYFRNVSLFYQGFCTASYIYSNDLSKIRIYSGDYSSLYEKRKLDHIYLIAYASDFEFQKPSSSMFQSIEIERKIHQNKLEADREREESKRKELCYILKKCIRQIASLILAPIKFLKGHLKN